MLDNQVLKLDNTIQAIDPNDEKTYFIGGAGFNPNKEQQEGFQGWLHDKSA